MQLKATFGGGSVLLRFFQRLSVDGVLVIAFFATATATATATGGLAVSTEEQVAEIQTVVLSDVLAVGLAGSLIAPITDRQISENLPSNVR